LEEIDLHYSQQPDEVSVRPISSDDPSEHSGECEFDKEHGIEELKEVENDHGSRKQLQMKDQLQVSSIDHAL